MRHAVILLGHGSRDPLWRLPMQAVAARIAERTPASAVRCAYLELCGPTLAEAAAELADTGVDSLRIFPLFLGVGKHAREDLPRLVGEIQAAHPRLKVELLPAAGEHAALIDLIAELAVA
jgi:sirohydrochlorin cobaltochelatase